MADAPPKYVWRSPLTLEQDAAVRHYIKRQMQHGAPWDTSELAPCLKISWSPGQRRRRHVPPSTKPGRPRSATASIDETMEPIEGKRGGECGHGNRKYEGTQTLNPGRRTRQVSRLHLGRSDGGMNPVRNSESNRLQHRQPALLKPSPTRRWCAKYCNRFVSKRSSPPRSTTGGNGETRYESRTGNIEDSRGKQVPAPQRI